MSCDVFVIFGITGDLAKVMTFRSLYRLEQRNLLDCPIVGVAVDDWNVDQLIDRVNKLRDRGVTFDDTPLETFTSPVMAPPPSRASFCASWATTRR